MRGQSGIRSGDARHESERKESRGATATDGDLSARALYLHLYYISTCYIGVLRVTIARSQFIGSPADNATKRRFSHHSHQRVIHFDFVSPLARIIERTNETYASTDVDELVRGVDFPQTRWSAGVQDRHAERAVLQRQPRPLAQRIS